MGIGGVDVNRGGFSGFSFSFAGSNTPPKVLDPEVVSRIRAHMKEGPVVGECDVVHDGVGSQLKRATVNINTPNGKDGPLFVLVAIGDATRNILEIASDGTLSRRTGLNRKRANQGGDAQWVMRAVREDEAFDILRTIADKFQACVPNKEDSTGTNVR